MKDGDLRVFKTMSFASHGRLFMEGQPIVLLHIDTVSLPYRRWWVLVDGKKDLCDEETMKRDTDEAR
jgi:hypothetical protein